MKNWYGYWKYHVPIAEVSTVSKQRITSQNTKYRYFDANPAFYYAFPKFETPHHFQVIIQWLGNGLVATPNEIQKLVNQKKPT